MTSDPEGRPVLTVILPCAGRAVRFQAPYPKELHRVQEGVSVVDLALRPVAAFAQSRHARIRVVVVIAPHKTALVDYLARYSDMFELVYTYQTRRHGPELAGAVAAALPLCVGDTVLVLPDQIVHDEAGDAAFARAVDLLGLQGCLLLATLVDSPERLAGEGALKLSGAGPERTVLAAAEKPAEPDGYDAAWVTVFARADERHRLRDVVTAEGAKAVVGATALLIDGFANINTMADL